MAVTMEYTDPEAKAGNDAQVTVQQSRYSSVYIE